MLNIAFRRALVELLYDLAGPSTSNSLKDKEVEDLADAWFSDPKAKKEVSKMLDQYHLDESTIEAEAIRMRSLDLEVFDRMQALRESRRDRAYRRMADYKESFAERVHEVSERMIEGAVARLENRSARKSA